MAEAYDWYEERATALGMDFLDSAEAVFFAITENPYQYPVIYRNVRRALTRRFPYEVFYVENDTSVSVLAVMHTRRDPKRWQRRV